MPDSGPFTMAAGGNTHSIALRTDGSVAAWGANNYGQCDVPAPNSGFTAVTAGYDHCVGLKSDGTLVAWGDNYYGQCDVPSGNSFVAVRAGGYHTLALKADGSVVAWGRNNYGQCTVPSPNSGFIAVAGGGLHSLGLRSDGSITAWGANMDGQCDVPEPNTGFVAMDGGSYHSIGLKEVTTSAEGDPPAEQNPGVLSIHGITPSPVSGAYASILYETPGFAPLVLEVFDTTGRRVGFQSLGVPSPGLHTHSWHGVNASGADLAPGVYILRLQGADQQATARVVRTR